MIMIWCERFNVLKSKPYHIKLLLYPLLVFSKVHEELKVGYRNLRAFMTFSSSATQLLVFIIVVVIIVVIAPLQAHCCYGSEMSEGICPQTWD
jgi:hypothetical protein